MTVSFAVFAIFAGVFPLLFGLFGLVKCDSPFCYVKEFLSVLLLF